MIDGALAEMLSRNRLFAEKYQAPPSGMEMVVIRRASRGGIVMISCSDTRINPYQIFGFDTTLNATVISIAGGRASDAIRTLAIFQTVSDLGTIVVMHHTDCGLSHFRNSDFKKALLEAAPTAQSQINSIHFGEIANGLETSIREDVALLRASPLIKADTQIVGLKCDIETGVLTEVGEEASNS